MVAARAFSGCLAVLLLAGCGSSPESGGYDNAGNAVQGGATSAPTLQNDAPACGPGGAPLFANAVCVCSDLLQVGWLTTVASTGPADVGVNGQSAAAAGTHIGGSWTAYDGLLIGGDVQVDGNLVTADDLTGLGRLDVGRDLSVGGALSFAGSLQVQGTLRSAKSAPPASADIGATGPYTAPAGPPCGCGDQDILDVGALVAAASKENDDQARGFAPDGLNMFGLGATTKLSTGTYYIADGTRVGTGKVVIDGAVRLFVGNSLAEVAADQFELAPGATLDLYVDGLVVNVGEVKIGDGLRPDAFRMYMGGAGTTSIAAGVQRFDGMVYAPRARVAFLGVTEVHGALFAKTLSWGGALDVVYAPPAPSGPRCAPVTPAR